MRAFAFFNFRLSGYIGGFPQQRYGVCNRLQMSAPLTAWQMKSAASAKIQVIHH